MQANKKTSIIKLLARFIGKEVSNEFTNSAPYSAG